MSDVTDSLFATRPIRTILLFVLLAAGARFVPAPWWEGNLLGVEPELPDPSGSFVAAPEANESVKQKLAKVELGGAEKAESPTDDQEDQQAESAEPTPAKADSDPSGQPTGPDEKPDPEPEPTFVREASADPDDLALLESMRRLDHKLDEPPVELQRPCLDYYPGYLTDSYRPICRRRALDPLFDQLREVALKSADRPARFTQLGDSLIAGDAFTGELRRLMGEQFGDGGFGYVHAGRASAHIHTRHLSTDTSSDWRVHEVIHDPHDDVKFGLAGVAFEARGAPTLGVSPHAEGHGRSFDRLGMLYYRKNRRVDLRVAVDGKSRRVDLSGPPGTNAIHWMKVERGTHDLRVSGFDRSAYFYGFLLENSGPGVVVDNLGLSNGRAPRLNYVDARQWQKQIEMRRPDALSFAYGVNSAGEHKASDRWLDEYADQYTELLETARQASDETGCMVMSLLTRAGKEDGEVVVYSSVEPLVRHQREAARRANCAFWNAYRAMGGEDGAEQWYDNRPRLLGSDLAHPTGAGYKKLANLFYTALIREFRRYLDERIRRSTIPELREDDVSKESILSLRTALSPAQRAN